MRPVFFRPLTLLGTVLAISAVSLVTTAHAQPRQGGVPSWTTSSDPLEAGLQDLERSRYEQAVEQLKKATRGPKAASAWLGIARAHLAQGKYDEAVKDADRAAASAGQTKADAAEVKARALAAQGKVEQAVQAVRSVENMPEARRARLLLGELLIRQGKRADARDPLMTLIRDYNDDRITERDAEGLALVGRAAHMLRSAADANDAFNDAEKAGGKRVETLLWRAELFLEKYDAGHADEVVREALEIAPDNPDARVMLARVKLDQAYDFAAAEAAIDRALETNPNHTGAFFVRAGLALRTFDLAGADAAVDRGLRVDPHDLALLSMRATTRFLADDTAGFEVARKAVLDRNPEYSEMYQIIGEFAEWEHRYESIVQMMQDAVQINPRDGKAWAVLGLNLIRLGDEDPGVEALRNSWKFDRFNVRVYNTLDLYEKAIPTHYDTVLQGSFRYRFDKTERALLERYLPPMLEEAFASMAKRLRYTPKLPVGIELYSDNQHFSVRTSGLPHIGIQGVCFGRTLAATSPRGETFNWGNVLWHELSHVFAIQMSKSHVPRWFTEGLSEYETFIRHPEWQREEDMPLYVALRAGRIPKVANFNRAFTHVDDAGDVTMAYYAASQIVTYIAEQHGMDKIAQMLRLWGEGVRDAEVVKRGLGMDMDTLDSRFRAWLAPRLARYDGQFVPDLRAPDLERAEKAAKQAPGDLRKRIELVIAQAGADKVDEAKAGLEALKKDAPRDPHVRYLAARFAAGTDDMDGAKAILEQMVRDKQDGYAVRMRLADVAEGKEDFKAMRAHLEAARRFDPTQVEALQALHDLAKKEKREADVIAALRELSVMDQHEPRAAVRLLQQLVDARQWNDAVAAAPRAIFVAVNMPAVHRLYGQALAQTKQYDRAIFELESALMCEPKPEEALQVFLTMSRTFKAKGDQANARKAAEKALEIDPDNSEAKELLSGS